MSTIQEAADKIGVSHWVLRKRIKARGIEGKEINGVIDLTDAEIEILGEKRIGRPKAEIAEDDEAVEEPVVDEPKPIEPPKPAPVTFKPGSMDAARAIYKQVMKERGQVLPPIELPIASVSADGVVMRHPLKPLPPPIRKV